MMRVGKTGMGMRVDEEGGGEPVAVRHRRFHACT